MLRALWFAAVVGPALALPQASHSVSDSEDRFLTENHLIQLFASGDVAVDLKTLIPTAKIFVPEGKFFDQKKVVVPSGGPAVGSIQATLETGLQSCKTCADGQFTSTACTLTDDTKCTNCRYRQNNEYEVSACVRGDANTVGADAQAAVCTAPVAGTSYVKTACGQKDTVIDKCLVPSDQQYIRADCIPGDIKTPGTDTVIGNCNKPSGNQWVKKTCDAKSDATIADCTSPQSGFYIQTACVQGTIRQQGSDTVIQPCTAPGTKQYTTQACSRDRDTQFGTCDEPAQGFFTTTECKPGSALAVGQNTKTQACQTPGPDKYFTKTCVSGSWSTVGADAQFASCSNPEPGYFTSSLCTSTQNTQFTVCTKRQANSYITSDCVAGSYNKIGSDLAQLSCSGPSDGFFVSGICTDYQNTATTKCKTAGQSEYIEPSGVCVPGSAYVKGSDAVVKSCSTAGSGSYIKTGCTATSNAAVVSCDGPATGFFTSTVCSATSNTLTTACKTAGTGQFVATACNPGTATSLGSDTVVKDCRKADAGYYIKTACGPTTDAVQEKCSEPPSGSYVTSICTGTSNTAWADCAKKTASQYFSSKCQAGSSTQLGANAVVRDCTTSKSGSYVSKTCADDQDTGFTACKTPGASDYSVPCQFGSASALGADTFILPASPITCGGSKTGTADASRSLQGDSVYPITISAADEVREVTFSTCGFDATFRVFSNPSTQLTVTTAPCPNGQKGTQGWIELTAGTYTAVVTGNTAGAYTLSASCADQIVLSQQRFQLFRGTVNNAAAIALCASHGMSLGHITSVDESNQVGALVKAAGLNSWIGVNDISNEGFYKLTFNDEDLSFTKWAPGEPNNVGSGVGEDCVEIYGDGNWNDLSCDAARAVVCSKYKPSRTVITANQLFVHFRDTSTNYEAARQVCVNNGMRLAHVTNAVENAAVASLVTATSAGSWIGINDNNIADYWAFTAFGNPVTFTNWAPNEPNNYQNTHEACVQMYTNGKWNDLPCDRSLTFVCSAYLPARTRATEVQLFVQFDDVVNFATAQSTCKSNGMGLAVISGSDDVTSLVSLFTTATNAPVWIGAYNPSGTLVLDGTNLAPAVFTNWNSAPSSSNYCVESATNGKWNAVSCDSTRRFVCSALRDTQTKITTTQKVLIFPRTKKNYQDAMNLCSSYGLHLAHNIAQSQAAMGTLVAKYNDANAWVGANDVASEGSWVNQLGGQPATINWGPGEPNNAGEEDCAELRADGLMNDVPCNANRRILCSAFLFDIRTSTRRFVVSEVRDSNNKLITCESFGLFSDPPNSAAENKPVSDVCAVIPGMTLLGAKKVGGKFVSDKTKAALPYTNFDNGEGNTAGEDCLRLRSTGYWNDFSCTPSPDYAMRVCVVP